MTDLDARADHQVALEEHQREEIVLQAALVEALGELHDITKARTANAGTYSYAYAGLADVLAVSRPVLAKHYLALSQRITSDVESGTVSISTRILHVAGGSYDAGKITLPLGANVQATGSTISYARRYAILAALGITGTDDDDDGQAAAVTPAPVLKRAERDPAGAQMRKIGALMDEAGIPKDPDTRRAITAAVVGRRIKTRAELTGPERAAVINALEMINAGQAALELLDDGTYRIVAIDTGEAT